MASTDGPWIRTADDLRAVVGELAGCRAVALDTEGDTLHHYRDRVCLVQLAAAGGGAWLVDPLALPELAPLAPLLADPAVVKILHGGDHDIASLKRDFGFRFRSLFDTAIAARLLGDSELGLQALVRNELGVELEKGSQRDDWSRRPLTARQEAYALADVEHLFALASRLTGRLAAAGRTEWAREEFEALAEVEPTNRKADPDDFRRIKGSSKLSRQGLAVLRELYAWREARAAAADRPPFHIVDPSVLLSLASDPPATVDEVASLLPARQAAQAADVLDAIDRALDLPEDEWPGRPPSERPFVSPAARRRIDALRAWRTEQAEQSALDPSVVLPQRLIERLAAARPRTHAELATIDGLRRWRVREWGDALLAACG